MRKLAMWMLWTGVVALFCVTTVACTQEEQPECQSTLDCSTGQSCIKEKCVDRGDINATCGDGVADCKDGLICDKSICKKPCQSLFDCAANETCDTTSGICVPKGSGDAGSENVPEDNGPKKDVGERCGPGLACKDGLSCVRLKQELTNGKCWAKCKQDAECKDGRVCSGGHCVPYKETCQFDSAGKVSLPCWAGLECYRDSPQEGTCFRPCTDDKNCAKGQSCIDKTGGKRYCDAAQDQAGTGQPCGEVGGKQVACLPGNKCVPERVGSSKKICTKECKGNDDCSWPRNCQGGLCVLPPNAGTAQEGAPCQADSSAPANERCDAEFLCLVVGKDAKKGRCYRNCTDAKAKPCASGTACLGIGTSKYCLKACKEPKDCSGDTPNCAKIGQQTQAVCIHKND